MGRWVGASSGGKLFLRYFWTSYRRMCIDMIDVFRKTGNFLTSIALSLHDRIDVYFMYLEFLCTQPKEYDNILCALL
jgi:hypothetical protein